MKNKTSRARNGLKDGLMFSSYSKILIILLSLFSVLYPVIELTRESKQVKLGLDLEGGSYLLFKVNFDGYIKERLDLIKSEVRTKFYEKNIIVIPVVSKNAVLFSVFNSKSGDDKAVRDIIESIDPSLAIEKVGTDYKIFFTSETILQMKQMVINQSIEIIRRRIDENGLMDPTIYRQGEDYISLQVPNIKDSERIKYLLGKTAKLTFHFLADDMYQIDNSASSDHKYITDKYFRLRDKEGHQYIVNREVVLSGDMLAEASATYSNGNPVVSFKFNNIGTKKFAKITSENIGRILAIVLDNEVITAPRINSVIPNGSGIITGDFTIDETSKVALLLRAGSLPAQLDIIQEKVIGPSLGIEAIKAGKVAVLFGFLAVSVIMIIFYRTFGLIANIALIVSIAMLFSLMMLLNVTLTLPGIAGVILTIGMAVDSNVLIFERIKEEKKKKSAENIYNIIDVSFHNAFRTILDSNITTLIIAIILYFFGSGPIKGFSATLSIGILTSIFSSIFLTRLIIIYFIEKKIAKKLSSESILKLMP